MSTKLRIGVAAAALSLIAGAAVWRLQRHPLALLVDTSPHARVIEGRLTGGFAWAPLERTTSSAIDAHSATQGFTEAAAVLRRSTAGDSSHEAEQARAISRLLAGNAREAVRDLATLASRPDADAHLLSDLAAAQCELAIRAGNPALLADALASADAALQHTPELPEALFNRALILEHLGLRDLARVAWRRFSTAEDDAEWVAEAHRRIAGLAPVVWFGELLDTDYERLAADPEYAREVARREPLDARRWAETKILGDWAAAERAGNHAAADRHLRVARNLAPELLRNRGEGMLAGAVAAIDTATPDRRTHLVAAHVLFWDGQQEFMGDHAAAAQRLLIRAADEFRAGGSPLALVAEYYVAHTFHALGDIPEARRREQQLLATAPPQFPAHRAQLLWHIGLGHQADGDWGAALTAFQESVAIFDRLGETEFAASVRGLIAEVADRTGDRTEAWQQRIAALQALGRATTVRLQMSLDSVARGAIERKEWPVAVSFLDLASEVAGRIDDPLIAVEMRCLQARAYSAMGRSHEAANAIGQARAAAARIDDTAAHDVADADIRAVEAMVAATPPDALRLLTAAIQYHRTKGRRIRLPDLLLSRGRAFRAVGDDTSAAADFEAGIAQLEQYREALPPGEQRWGVFHAANELFQEALALALRRGDHESAFLYAERARARQLLETLGQSKPAIPRAIAPDVVLVEYFVLPGRVAIFVSGAGGLDVVEAPIDPRRLEREAQQFSHALMAGDGAASELAQSLHRHLIEPIAQSLAGKRKIVFVAAAPLAAIPFAALRDGEGTFLVQRHEVVVAPSASVYTRLASRERLQGGRRRLLAVANPTVQDRDALPGAEREAAGAATMYAAADVLSGRRATVHAFSSRVADASVIHLGMHGVVSESDEEKSALLFADGRLDIASIAALRLPATEAVVVAACSSARGVLLPEGTMSVARAFLAAGVPSVVATLWDIGDGDSAAFFLRLHVHLGRGLSAAEALRAAQIEAIERGDPPKVWAAMQSIGS